MQQVVYVASPVSQQIHVFSLLANGDLQLLQTVATLGQVQPLLLSPNGQWLYGAQRPDFAVVSYRIGPDGQLKQQGMAPLAGSPSHTAITPCGRFLLAASYAFNHVTVSAIDAAGQVAPPHQQWDGLQAAHSVTLLSRTQPNDQQEVLVACLKEDAIRRFFLTEQGTLLPHPRGAIPTAAGAGPRHLALHPTHRDIYCLNELDCTINRYQREDDGQITLRQRLPMLPAGYQGEHWGADLHVTPDGRFLYSSERASSLLTLFAIAPHDGNLSLLGHYPTESMPRGFAIDQGGRYLLAAGQTSHHLAVHRINEHTGELTLHGRYPVGEGAMWVRVLTLAPSPSAMAHGGSAV
ncbi:beta-propeller fold lactonase family protein [Aeromonas cavernicola]|uniref:6-phosphogluconolactonase n=1 Tax=Aeromonas cavernicola TaxID=1006623 RepID=A0A2H9U0X0_9GAMM|nr:beta-propeller fold lactonase family protein [Aeromonas cavernicola]PJG57661.1 6-phosphogluconolactonase [Aeromonas cavernicola]